MGEQRKTLYEKNKISEKTFLEQGNDCKVE
jgi:hypothetical protein